MSEIQLDSIDNRLIASLTPEQRLEHYTAMYKFWKSVCDKYPSQRNISMAGRFKTLKERKE